MNLSLADSANVVTFQFPAWIVHGVVVAIIVTAVLVGIVLAFSAMFNSLTMGWLSADNPLKDIRALVAGFVWYGLIPGLGGSAAWTYINPWVGVFVGLSLFACIYVVLMARQNSRNHRGKSVMLPSYHD